MIRSVHNIEKGEVRAQSKVTKMSIEEHAVVLCCTQLFLAFKSSVALRGWAEPSGPAGTYPGTIRGMQITSTVCSFGHFVSMICTVHEKHADDGDIITCSTLMSRVRSIADDDDDGDDDDDNLP